MAFFDQFGGGLGRYTGALDAAQPGAGGPGGGASAQDRQILSDAFNGPGVKKGMALRMGAIPSLIDQLIAQQPGGQAGGGAPPAYTPLSQLAAGVAGPMGGGPAIVGDPMHYRDAATGQPLREGALLKMGYAAPMLAQLGLTGPPPGGGTSPAGPPQGGGAPGGTVLLRAPTGQTQAVPAAQVAYYVARGATRV